MVRSGNPERERGEVRGEGRGEERYGKSGVEEGVRSLCGERRAFA